MSTIVGASAHPSATRRYWIRSLGLSLALFVLGAFELSARRGWAVNLYLANKVLGGTALLMVALAVAFGALQYFRGRARTKQARYFGLVGYGYALLHVGATLFVGDPEQAGTLKFPFPAYYLEHGVSILCSVVAFVLLTVLVVRSVRGGHGGRRTQLRWMSYATVVLGLVHAVLLKVEGWQTWFATWEPRLPPLSLLTVALVLALVGVKAAHLAALRRDRLS